MKLFYHQSWFWIGFFTTFASLGGILIKEFITNKAQIKLERIKIYESDIFNAYKNLYDFISCTIDVLWPPNEPEVDFRQLMHKYYSKDVKKYMLFYSQEIRTILSTIESHNFCLNDPDAEMDKTFDEFYRDDLYKLLNKLEKIIELKIDKMLYVEE